VPRYMERTGLPAIQTSPARARAVVGYLRWLDSQQTARLLWTQINHQQSRKYATQMNGFLVARYLGLARFSPSGQISRELP